MKKHSTCLEQEQIFLFAHNMMDEREAERARLHISACKACRSAADEYRKLDRALDGWKVTGPSPWFDSKLRATLAAAPAARRGFFGLPGGRWLAPASLAAMLVFGVVMVHTWRQPAHLAPSGAPADSAQATSSSVQPPALLGPSKPAEEELSLYKNLPMLENYDMLANFDVLSELAKDQAKTAD